MVRDSTLRSVHEFPNQRIGHQLAEGGPTAITDYLHIVTCHLHRHAFPAPSEDHVEAETDYDSMLRYLIERRDQSHSWNLVGALDAYAHVKAGRIVYGLIKEHRRQQQQPQQAPGNVGGAGGRAGAAANNMVDGGSLHVYYRIVAPAFLINQRRHGGNFHANWLEHYKHYCNQYIVDHIENIKEIVPAKYRDEVIRTLNGVAMQSARTYIRQQGGIGNVAAQPRNFNINTANQIIDSAEIDSVAHGEAIRFYENCYNCLKDYLFSIEQMMMSDVFDGATKHNLGSIKLGLNNYGNDGGGKNRAIAIRVWNSVIGAIFTGQHVRVIGHAILGSLGGESGKERIMPIAAEDDNDATNDQSGDGLNEVINDDDDLDLDNKLNNEDTDDDEPMDEEAGDIGDAQRNTRIIGGYQFYGIHLNREDLLFYMRPDFAGIRSNWSLLEESASGRPFLTASQVFTLVRSLEIQYGQKIARVRSNEAMQSLPYYHGLTNDYISQNRIDGTDYVVRQLFNVLWAGYSIRRHKIADTGIFNKVLSELPQLLFEYKPSDASATDLEDDRVKNIRHTSGKVHTTVRSLFRVHRGAPDVFLQLLMDNPVVTTNYAMRTFGFQTAKFTKTFPFLYPKLGEYAVYHVDDAYTVFRRELQIAPNDVYGEIAEDFNYLLQVGIVIDSIVQKLRRAELTLIQLNSEGQRDPPDNSVPAAPVAQAAPVPQPRGVRRPRVQDDEQDNKELENDPSRNKRLQMATLTNH